MNGPDIYRIIDELLTINEALRVKLGSHKIVDVELAHEVRRLADLVVEIAIWIQGRLPTR